MSKRTPKTPQPKDPRRKIPSVSSMLEDKEIQRLIATHSLPLVKEVLREALAYFSQELKKQKKTSLTKKSIVKRVEDRLIQENVDRLRPVVNAAGIILHTGLGRAVLPQVASKALSHLDCCTNLQIDMKTGERGRRNYMTERLLCKLTKAEAAMVVNNNAAATFLILSVFCQGKEVIVSRGQLIEIGGSFRLPDCIRQSGAIMKEVSTTNKTHLRDYENALNENTGVILRVHPSNYRIVGFTKQVEIKELASIKKKSPIILVDDLGCGALVDLAELGLPNEPTVPGSLADGADLVCSSGDKLVGGPQAGIIVGKKELITRIKKHPLTRMLRVCKLTDIALERTLRLFLDPEELIQNHPTLHMMTVPMDVLKKRAFQLKRALYKAELGFHFDVMEGESAVGGGTMPDHPLPTFLLAVESPSLSTQKLSRLLRENEPPVITRIMKNKVVFDMRTLLKGEDKVIHEAMKGIASSLVKSG